MNVSHEDGRVVATAINLPVRSADGNWAISIEHSWNVAAAMGLPMPTSDATDRRVAGARHRR